jgi:hypothetical protein
MAAGAPSETSRQDHITGPAGLPGERRGVMALTLWTNEITGERLDRLQLDGWRRRARRLYEVNSHIFEDELEALAALGVVPATVPGAVSIAAAFLPPAA